MKVRGCEQKSKSLRHAELGSESGVLEILKMLDPKINPPEQNGQVQGDGATSLCYAELGSAWPT